VDFENMSESFAELFEQSVASQPFKPGAILTGRVVDVNDDVVIVNAGLKSEAVIPAEQFRDDQGQIEVAVGDEVDRGTTLARTGSTGLAMGDHLHFEVLVGGLPVSPLQWWDAGWMRDHVTEPLREAGAPLF